MAEYTLIEWATHTFNPWVGCTKISPACDNCYAERWAGRCGRDAWGPGRPRERTSPANWRKPLKWHQQAAMQQRAWDEAKAELPGLDDAELQARGFVRPQRPRVFCASLADVFDNAAPDEWRRDLFALIEATPYLDWLLLTKRIGNVRRMVPTSWLEAGWPPHVWMGITVVNQDEADRDIPKLLDLPASIRFLSIEPMLGPIDLTRACGHCRWTDKDGVTCCAQARHLDWIIVGGETGPSSRPMHPDWVRSLRDQCQAARVPFFFKQWGDHVEWDGSQSPSPSTRMADMTPMARVGKSAAGRLLDGREWMEAPQ